MPFVTIDQFVLTAFAGVLIWAALSDLSRYIIPNYVCAALIALYPVHVLSAATTPDFASALLIAALVFALGTVVFGLGFMGGGDVKLMTIVALWAGPPFVVPFILTTTMAGGLLATFMLTPFGALMPNPPVVLFREGLRPRRAKQSMPYGIAIAVGGVFTAIDLMMVGH